MRVEKIEEGDLVTVPSKKFSNASNTYRVHRKLNDEYLLIHPLSDECFILRHFKELNKVQAIPPNPIECCLAYAKKNDGCIGHTMKAELAAMTFFFLIKKEFTMRQRSELASICGKVASVILHNDLQNASSIVSANVALLDDFHQTLYNNFLKVINNINTIKTKNERYTLFNLAGFVLAQLRDSIYE